MPISKLSGKRSCASGTHLKSHHKLYHIVNCKPMVNRTSDVKPPLEEWALLTSSEYFAGKCNATSP